jgi:hypothetical protein
MLLIKRGQLQCGHSSLAIRSDYSVLVISHGFTPRHGGQQNTRPLTAQLLQLRIGHLWLDWANLYWIGPGSHLGT